jgi:hypothetical protein
MKLLPLSPVQLPRPLRRNADRPARRRQSRVYAGEAVMNEARERTSFINRHRLRQAGCEFFQILRSSADPYVLDVHMHP